MNSCVRMNSMKSVMKHSLLLCFIIFLPLSLNMSLATGTGNSAAIYCPLNITVELDAQPWMLRQCTLPDKSHCCQGISDLIKILHFSWMHTTRSFLFPSNHTAAICLNEFQRQVEARARIGSELFRSCNVRSENFVCDSQTCLGIDNLRTFESKVDTSGMKLHCNGSRPGEFQCGRCLRAMGMALHSLNQQSGGKSNCQMFVMIYVGGGINCYDGLGPDAAYCLLSVQNVTALANFAEPNRRNRIMKRYFFAIIPALGILVVGLSICLCLNRRKTRLWQSKRMKLMQRYESLSSSTGLTFFDLSEIRDSTGNFATSNMIGEGGFSTVYRGTLPNGSRIAVKRLKYSTKIKGDADFSHELHVIGRIKHCNLLPLRGYCVEFDKDGHVSEQLLVSDFMDYSTRTVGTLGYVAPEYALYGHLTDKSDVFSFGIILLELITGRRALDSTSGVLEHFLVSDWVVDMKQKKRAEEVIDMRIRDCGYRKTIDKVLLLALLCAHPRVVSRPSISEALLALEAIDGPLLGTREIESELEVSCNSRGDLTWFLSSEGRTDETMKSLSNSLG